MKKSVFLISVVLGCLLVSCNSTPPAPSQDGTDGTTHTSPPNTPETTVYYEYAEPEPYIVEGPSNNYLSAFEISIPEVDGTINYTPKLSLFKANSGEVLSVASATRVGDSITFSTAEKEYYFSYAPFFILNESKGEMFSFSGRKNGDSYEYTATKCQFLTNVLENCKNIAGNDYDSLKTYFLPSTTFCLTYANEDKDFSQKLANTVNELLLPKDGETLNYPEGFVLVDGHERLKLMPVSASRNGDTITFVTEHRDYYYAFLKSRIVVEGKEAFVPVFADRTENGTYNYVFKLWQPYLNKATEDFMKLLGEKYDSQKSYIHTSKVTVHQFVTD